MDPLPFPAIHNVPDDILILVFFAILPLDLTKPILARTRLSHVCKRWRNLALDTAQLWSTITFEMKYNPEPVDPQVEFARQAEWVLRSKGAPLDIEVPELWHVDDIRIEEGRAKIRWIIELLKPHADRWRLLYLKSRESQKVQLDYFFQQAGPLHLPNLLILAMHPTNGYKRWTILSFGPGATPNLVYLVAPTEVDFDRPFVQSLRNLQLLEMSHFNFNADVVEAAREIVAFLRQSPGLRSLKITGRPGFGPFQWKQPEESTREVFTAPQLIDIQISWPNLQAAVLPFVHLPAVTYCRQGFWPELLPIIHMYNPFPNVRDVRISETSLPWPYPMAELPSLLSHLHALDRLAIEKNSNFAHPDADREWVRGFATVCPKLKALRLSLRLGISEDALRAMVEGRKARGQPITILALDVSMALGVSDDLVAWLKSNIAEVKILNDEGNWILPPYTSQVQ